MAQRATRAGEGPAPGGRDPGQARRGRWLRWLEWGLAPLVALLLAWGSLDAGLISDDGAVLGYVHREGLASDWHTTQYDLRTVRFWRPLVTTSLAVQEAWTGVRPAPLRLFNLACHAAAALLLGALARRLGAGRAGAAAVAVLAAAFPAQGGTVTWVVGRVDSLPAPLALAACLFALDRRRLAAAVACLLACASKEIAFVTPLWAFLLAWGRGDRVPAAARAALPVALAAGVAFGWRAYAIGDPVGGYTREGGLEADLPLLVRAWAVALVWPLGGALAALGLGRLAGTLRPRPWLAAVAASAAAALPLYHVLAPGTVDPVHQRTLLFCDLPLMLAVGAALGRPRRPPVSRRFPFWAAWLVVAALGTQRLVEACGDVDEWTAAGRLAESHVARTRATLEGLPAADEPVLDSTFPATQGGAYVLSLIHI